MDTMLSKALSEFTTGPLNRLIVNLGGQDGDQWEQQLKQFLHKEPCWTNGKDQQVAEPKPTPSILELVSTIVVNATTGKFVAKEKFVINTERNAPARIRFLGKNFSVLFLGGDGKIEDPIMKHTLLYYELRQPSMDSQIITELGGEAKAETTLSEMFYILEKGPLKKDFANIFYIKDIAGVLRTVIVYLYDTFGWYGWGVGVDFVEKKRWLKGNRVFSRNSLISVIEPLELSAPARV